MSHAARSRQIFANALQPLFESLERRQLLSASTLDPTYGTNGVTFTDFNANGGFSDAAIQADNKVVVGSTDVDQFGTVIERYTTTGQLDPSFGAGGEFRTLIGSHSEIESVKIDSLNRVVAAGVTDSGDFILRLTSTGTLDTSFGDLDPSTPGGHSGVATLNIPSTSQEALAIRPTGEILLTGNGDGTSITANGEFITFSFIAQYTSAGLPDPGFGDNGITQIGVNNSFDANTLGLQSNGTAIVGGNTNDPIVGSNEIAFVAIDTSGHLQNSFGTSGVVTNNVNLGAQITELTIDSGDNIDASVEYTNEVGNGVFSVYRFTSSGAPDSAYGNGGIASLNLDPADQGGAFGLTTDSANRVVATGFFTDGNTFQVLLARFDTSGNPDATFAANGFVANSFTGFDAGVDPLIQTDGRIVVSGLTGSTNFLARYGDAPVTPPPPPPTPVTVDSNGNLLIPGTNGNDNFQVSAVAGGIDVIYNGVDAGVFSPTGIIIATGKNGNDVININSNVTLAASVTGGAGDDSLSGGSGNDTIVGNAGNNSLAGGAGNDSITSGGGSDTVNGGDGNNTLGGGAGIDVITAGNGNNIITGASAGDSITVGNGNNSISGGAGNDAITAGNGNNTINGGAGDDVIVSGVGNSNIDGGAGNDSITVAGGTTTLSGGAGDDTILGGTGADSVDGGAGNDIIVGGTGADSINGGADRDILIGGAGADSIVGGGDDDILVGSTTAYDSNLTALNSIKAEWISSNTYAQRVANIRNGTGSANRQNGAFFLTSGTVFNDAASDNLTGSAGSDLFYFSSSNDHVTDLGKAETEVNV